MRQSPHGEARLNLEDYRVAAEQSVDGVFITAPDGRILYANPAACAMLRATEGEVIRTGRQGLSPAGDPRWAAAAEERARTGQTKFVAPMLRRDGSRFLAELTSSIFEGSDGEARSIVIARDVTAQYRLEQRSRALHEITGEILSGVGTQDVLALIGRHARSLLEGSDAAIFTATDRPGHVRIVATDGGAITQLMGREYPPESMAAQVMEAGKSLLVEHLTAAARTPDGRSVGLGPGVLVPIIAGEQVFGAIMVGAQPGSRPYDAEDLEDVKEFADAAAVALDIGQARAELETFHRQRSEQLQQALDSRVIIEQAKGYLAGLRGIGSEEAFDRLRKYARSHSTNVHEVAARVMDHTLML